MNQTLYVLATALLLAAGTRALAQDENAEADAARVPVATPVERVFLRSAADTGSLAEQYPHLAIWLEPEDAPRVLALVERETTAKPDGAIVILSGEGQSANDGLLEGLRARLSEAGWAAMTLGLEQPSPSLLAARKQLANADAPAAGDDGASQSVMIDVNEQAVKELLQAHRKEIDGRLSAAVAWFTEQGYQRIVLAGVGRGANEVSAYLAKAPAAVKQVVWMVADFGGQSPDELSGALSSVADVPMLDLYSTREAAAPLRVAAFRRLGMGSYQAMAAPVPVRPGSRDAMAIANRLLGWLK